MDRDNSAAAILAQGLFICNIPGDANYISCILSIFGVVVVEER
jgi:hypothetical protein